MSMDDVFIVSVQGVRSICYDLAKRQCLGCNELSFPPTKEMYLYRLIGSRIILGMVTIHLINSGPLNPYFQESHGSINGLDFSLP